MLAKGITSTQTLSGCVNFLLGRVRLTITNPDHSSLEKGCILGKFHTTTFHVGHHSLKVQSSHLTIPCLDGGVACYTPSTPMLSRCTVIQGYLALLAMIKVGEREVTSCSLRSIGRNLIDGSMGCHWEGQIYPSQISSESCFVARSSRSSLP